MFAKRALLSCIFLTPLILVNLFCTPVVAQRPNFTIPDWAIHLYYSASKNPLFSSHLRQFPEFLRAASTLQRFTASIEGAVLAHLRTGRSQNGTQRFQPCNHDGRGVIKSIEGYFGIRGLPAPPLDCITDIHDTTLYSDQKPPFSVSDVYDALLAFTGIVFRERFTLVRSARDAFIGKDILANWEKPDVTMNYPVSRRSMRCRIQFTGQVRVGAAPHNWYSHVTVTNEPSIKTLPHLDRQYFHEYVRVSRGPSADADAEPDSLTMTLPRFAGANASAEAEVPQNGTKTVFVRLRGSSHPATFGTMFPENNPAVRLAMDKADNAVQQTDDALAPSSLALLLMPLGLNLVPIALLTAVTTPVMVAYTVLSDVLSVIPLAIKGVELIVIGGKRHIGIVTRFTATMDGQLPDAAAAEIWAAECGTKGNVRPIGIAFLTLALVFMVGGITAEIWARRFMQRRMRRMQAEFEETARKALVQETDNYDDETYISSMGERARSRGRHFDWPKTHKVGNS